MSLDIIEQSFKSKRRVSEALGSPTPSGRHTINDRPTQCNCGHTFISHAPSHWCYNCKKYCSGFDYRGLGLRRR